MYLRPALVLRRTKIVAGRDEPELPFRPEDRRLTGDRLRESWLLLRGGRPDQGLESPRRLREDPHVEMGVASSSVSLSRTVARSASPGRRRAINIIAYDSVESATRGRARSVVLTCSAISKCDSASSQARQGAREHPEGSCHRAEAGETRAHHDAAICKGRSRS